MGWERRGGKRYYYRAKWVNGRTVKEYCGSGPDAEAAARQDLEDAEKARRAAVEFCEWQERQAEQMRLLDEIDRICNEVVAPAMTAAGYHKYRGVWRMKRKPREQAKPEDASGGGGC